MSKKGSKQPHRLGHNPTWLNPEAWAAYLARYDERVRISGILKDKYRPNPGTRKSAQ
jgi:hypothetical protein